MSKLYFKYGCMNSSKSANLLMIKHNYEEQGFRVTLLKPSVDNREGETIVSSRVGMYSNCIAVKNNRSIYDYFSFNHTDIIMIDEAQFLTREQVNELFEISFKINVICFGLLTDFKQELFEGSKRLIELSESFEEIKTVCKCGAKATRNVRFDSNGKIVKSGKQIDIGGNEKYKAFCKYCYKKLASSQI